MKDFNQIRQLFFIGIGGIGMSSLARYFNANGKKVSGYDSTPTLLTHALSTEGIAIHYEDDIKLIPKEILEDQAGSLVVYTPAIPKDHQQKKYLIDSGIKLFKRSQVLGALNKQGQCLAVAGTHGKTTTSAFLAHILLQSQLPVTAFLGGELKNQNSNLLIGPDKTSTFIVSEADEFDRSFLQLFPQHAIITSCDADHLDIYGNYDALLDSFELFVDQVAQNGEVIVFEGAVGLIDRIKEKKRIITYGTSKWADYRIFNIRYVNGIPIFDLKFDDEVLVGCCIQMQGQHNILNATAAAIMALRRGASVDLVKAALQNFGGIKRRFEIILNNDNHIFIDDYAHHPEEIKCFIEGARSMAPDRELTVIFQPHLFTRTQDFATDFAAALSMADKVWLLDIYPAREVPIHGVTSELIATQIEKNSHVETILAKNLLDKVRHELPSFLATVGAGDIVNFVEPIKQILYEVE